MKSVSLHLGKVDYFRTWQVVLPVCLCCEYLVPYDSRKRGKILIILLILFDFFPLCNIVLISEAYAFKQVPRF